MLGQSTGARLFSAFNAVFLIALSLLCIAPLVHIAAVSLSSSSAVTAGWVRFWPVDFTLDSYRFVMTRGEIWSSMWVTLQRVALGGGLNLLLTILIAYPLSKESATFRSRTGYAWFFFFTMLFSGGLIPWYMVIRQLELLDSIWALVLPAGVPVFNVVLMLNFFRQLPKELEEAAFMDGAGHWTTLWKIYLPAALPALATVSLFAVVWHWNSWFDGLILMNRPEHYPLQSYLQTVIMQRDMTFIQHLSRAELAIVSDRTIKSAQILIATLPIVFVYPFLQRFFVKGIVLGSVKG
ncbi:carbohydrate ABC transporter permease [Cohnella sp. LGH]|uniref:carbohydrate ABC transporter permease n=1 Tax=Cohnella sp. LGH TaxID=1619153 RepID=UPI001ADAFFDE|nr:carbohydrate ABC transporter permease [Cohnella sp. LGH]QTH43417.1 carbohydrate ABC transporter permease [Cohnella sp. LGH]